MVKIVQRDEPVLRKTAIAVPVTEITSKKIQTIIANMKKALAAEADGIAIAAPQIGEPYRIFVISGKIKNLNDNGDEKNEEDFIPASELTDEVYINPVMTKMSRNKEKMEEGCLSVRYLYGKVSRSVKATVKAYDENGKKIVRGGSGLRAQVFQHETDHLNGILFCDTAVDLREMPPESKTSISG